MVIIQLAVAFGEWAQALSEREYAPPLLCRLLTGAYVHICISR